MARAGKICGWGSARGWRPGWSPPGWRLEQAARGSAGGRYELRLREGELGRRRRLREHESAATAATAVEGARWPRSGPTDPALLTAAAATRHGRGSRRHGPQHRPPGQPLPLPRSSSLLPPPSSLLSPPWSLVGPARHGAASPPMALRRSMERSGLPPLPSPPPPLLLLVGLAALLLREPVAAGRGWPERRRKAGAAEGRGRGRSRGTEADRVPGLGGPDIWVVGPKLGGRGSGAGGGGAAVCRLPDVGAPTPNFFASGALLAGWKGKEWGCGLSGQRGMFGTGFFPPRCS